MKQKTKPIILTICISLVTILSISSYALFNINDQEEISNPKEVEGLAVLVDGEKTDTFPTKDSGKVFDKIECTNGGVAEWNSDTWKLAVRHINRSTECTVSFMTKVPTAADKLIELAASNSTEMFTDDTVDANIRYMGADPANYVDIGNGNDADGNPILWRIIGVMNNVDDGTGNKETRIKLIREKPIGNIAWDRRCTGTYDETANSCSSSSYKNNWETSSLNKTLNEAFYNGTKTIDPNYIYITDSNRWQKQDFSIIGLGSVNKDLIGDAVYHLGSSTSSNKNTLTALGYYEAERSNTVYNGRPTTWTGKIGLMYPSDYGYATNGGANKNKEACAAKELYNWDASDYADCKNNNWLFDSTNHQWMITPYASSAYYASDVFTNGYVIPYYVYNASAVRPVVYLRSDVKITGGEGTKENPYKLGI